MEKIVLIDGNSLVNRAYYALPPLNNPEGTPVQAVFGFATMLVKAIETVKPNYIVTAFDVHAPTFRHKMYDGYKGSRKGMPDDLAVQMPILKEMLEVMGIKCVEMAGYEADDLIGTLSKRFPIQTYIITGDRDSFQLIDGTTRVLLTKRGITETEELDEAALQSSYGLTPAGVIDYKALAGDSSDDIPGVAGIGDKTAKSLLSQYGSLDGIYEHIGEIGGATGKKLEDGKDSAYISYKLATIDTNAPIECELSECTYTFPFSGEVFAYFERQSFKSLVKRSEIFNAAAASTIEKTGKPKAEIKTLTGAEEIKKVVAGAKVLAVSLTVDEMRLSVSVEKEYAVKLKRSLLDDGVDENIAIAALKDAFSDRHIEKVLYDSKSFKAYTHANFGMQPERCFDIKLAQYLVDSTVPHGKMGELFEHYGVDSSDEASGLIYLRELLCSELESSGMHRLYYDIELPLVDVLLGMERSGFKVDRVRLKEIGESFNREEVELEKRIYEEAGQSFNIKSPKQLSKVLFDDMGIPYPTKSTNRSTGAEILEQLAPDYPIIPLIIRYRFITKLNSTYIEGLRKLLDSDDCVHTEFRQTMTATGRLSSVEPNLQNIPVREQDGKVLRSLFVARDGYTLVSADYSQIELRIMAHYSADPVMLEAYESGQDIHAYTAAKVYGVPLSEVTPDMRRTAKTVNFGVIYGMSDYGLAAELKISRTAAKKYIDGYFERFSGVRKYLDASVSAAKKNGFVSTLLGRRRKIPELYSGQYFTRQFGERAAMNTPLQGTAADIIKLAMLGVSRALEGMKSRLVLQIHDELVVEAADCEVEKVKEILRDKMENAFTLNVLLKVEIGEGKNLLECADKG